MYLYKNLLSILAVLLIGSFLPLAFDYYLINFFEGTVPEFSVPILMEYANFIIPNRVLVLVVYYFLILVALKMPHYAGPQGTKAEVSKSVQLSAFAVFLGAASFFIFFEYTGLNSFIFYPVAFLVALLSMPIAKFLFFVKSKRHISLVRRKKISSGDGITLETKNVGFVNVPEPERHTLIMGGSGSGKSASVVRPYLNGFVEKGYCGILYDYKAPTLINELNTILINNEGHYLFPYYIINFTNVRQSHRFNILCPSLLLNVNYAEEYALSIISNLNKDAAKQSGEFFNRSAINYLTAIIWFLKKRHPEYCTLPHVLNIALYHDFAHVFSMLHVEPQANDRIMSIVTSLQQKAERQLSGQMGTIQNQLATINTPEVAWILSGNDFIPDINDPDDPKMLAIGNDRQTPLALAPVISLIFTACLKTMNAEGKHKSFLLLDEGPTLNIPNLDNISAVSRSNKMSLVYIAQDFSMMHDNYGREKTNTIISNMANQFFGRVTLPSTAKEVSDMIGKEEREIVSMSEGQSSSDNRSNLSRNFTMSVQERLIVRPEEVRNLKKGEFIGNTTDEGQSYFWGRFREIKFKKIYQVEDFIDFVDGETGEAITDIPGFLEENLQRIKMDVETIVNSYPNIYKKEERNESYS